jgi:hypothetical protein
MCYGSDDYDGAPCLINSINAMLSHDADHSPSGKYPHIVRAFDMVNSEMRSLKVNKEYNIVAPVTAEILLANMGPLKEVPAMESVDSLTPEQFREWAKSRNALTGTPEGARIVSELMGDS